MSTPAIPDDADPVSTTSSGTGGRARINRVAIAVLLALALALGAAVQAAAGLGAGSTPSDARLGGDFPAFFAAGSIALDGDWDELYSSERQAEAQQDLGLDGFLAFAYPPHVALAMAPLAALGFRAGFAVHSVLMVAAAVGALWVLRPVCPSLRSWFLPATAATLAFYPLFRAATGGQNAALTLLLFAVVWRALVDDREVLVGLAAGLLLYRPQYALPVIGLLVVRRAWRSVGVAALVALATWSVSAAVLGPAWVSTWLAEVGPFVETDAEVNAANSISVLGFIQALVDSRAVLTYIVAAPLVVGVVTLLVRRWADHDAPIALLVPLVAVGSLLISPHTMFYDAALLVLVPLAFVALEASGAGIGVAPTRVAGAMWLAAFVYPLARAVDAPATPLFLVVLAGFVLLVREALRRPTAEVVALDADETSSPIHGKAA